MTAVGVAALTEDKPVSSSLFRCCGFAVVAHVRLPTRASPEQSSQSSVMPKQTRTNVKILMVAMPHDELGSTGGRTGPWLEESAAPHFVFRDAGVELTLAPPTGGQLALIESFYSSDKPAAAVCHSGGIFYRVMYEGEPRVKGKRVTGFTNGEESAVNLTHVVPFLVEDELKKIGGIYEKAAEFAPFAVVDGRVLSGQKRASSTAAAKALLGLLAVPKAI